MISDNNVKIIKKLKAMNMKIKFNKGYIFVNIKHSRKLRNIIMKNPRIC